MANPIYELLNYNVSREHVDRQIAALKKPESEFPFMDLDPRVAAPRGFKYWTRVLSTWIDMAAQQENTVEAALKRFAQQVAVIELVPYRSMSAYYTSSILSLCSVSKAKDFVHETLVPRAIEKEIHILVM